MKVQTIPVGEYQANCYLLINEEAKVCALVDPGEEADRLQKAVEATGCTLAYMLITHGHSDHVEAVPGLAKAFPDAVICLHEGDTTTKDKELFPVLDFPNVRNCVEGDALDFGGQTIKVLHTPGHSAGGICFQVGDVLFTGDTLFTGSIGRTDLEGGDYPTLMKSLKRIAQLPGDFHVLSGHMGPSTMERERSRNYYIREAMSL